MRSYRVALTRPGFPVREARDIAASARYCTPGEGCNTPQAYTAKERERARARKES